MQVGESVNQTWAIAVSDPLYLVSAAAYLLAALALLEWARWQVRKRDRPATEYERIIIGAVLATFAIDRLRFVPHHLVQWLGGSGLQDVIESTPAILVVNIALIAVWTHALHARWEARKARNSKAEGTSP